jgi:transcriptional regulator with XRE-family HTH domain
MMITARKEKGMETFGQRLRRLRKEKGYTQDRLARKMGILPKQISTYELGTFTPSLTTLEWLCEALDVTATELLGF